MPDDDHKAELIDAGIVSQERPLDALLPGLGTSRVLPPPSAVHQRVLEVTVDEGREWVLCVWTYPGSPQALHAQLQRLIEATLLAELTRPPSIGAEALSRRFGSLRLISFPVLGGAKQALAPFGLMPEPLVVDRFAERIRTLLDEADAAGWDVPRQPAETWSATIQRPPGARGDQLFVIQEMMADRMGDDVWGQTPGGPSKLFSIYVQQTFKEQLEPTLDGLRAMEMLLKQDDPHVIRWMPPLLFQALCDFVGVVAHGELGVEMGWGLCEPDASGYAQPPVYRIGDGEDAEFLPIGLVVLRWLVMPLRPGEEAATLADWLEDWSANR